MNVHGHSTRMTSVEMSLSTEASLFPWPRLRQPTYESSPCMDASKPGGTITEALSQAGTILPPGYTG